ncbi:hypothetical protein PAAG_11758 [Paracoccidioides lutzii Pb01]|uniref:Uncharacterized protein n=1 Tax=Paracoccidioides lutzii (strain ATCC MYA-826 / Pb01) TaxID=502779 RepID=A0A0A2V131_PARBA|nr:hypothetical protein PAAG_11758 [Paracoccidioides lutzii Pb01]KGQ01521.1 hypothetical protein PAAG_11758 [Paracoccidioides lutzii Pb01]
MASPLLIDPAVNIEEEKMPAYEKGLFYPVKLGEVFNSSYQVLGKLRFGANYTDWFYGIFALRALRIRV